MEKKAEELVNQIRQWVDERGNTVSYTVIEDIIKEEGREHCLNQVLYELSKEGVTIEPVESDETYPADGDEPEKFVPADVNIIQKPLIVYNLMERLQYDEIDLKPAFQRKGGLWSERQQSMLIESLMLKIPLPAFYFDASDDGRWVVIDGLQRLTAFRNYLIGEKKNGELVKKKFEGLQYLSEFNGLTFDELPRQYIRRIRESSIIAYIVEKGTPDEVIFNIFQRINTGGLRLSDQEIRHALYPGKGTDLTVKLAECAEFLEATQYGISPDRMLDREYITRFISFTELDYKTEYKGNIDNFLIKGLKCVNTYEDERLEQIEHNFKKVMWYVKNIFGRYAFRKYGMNWRRGPINKALFELWAICFSPMSKEQLDGILERKDEFLRAFQELLQKPEFASALRGGDSYAFEKRVSMARDMIEGFLC